jgi:hypothetical protein
LWLTEASRIGFANALALLGVHAPDEMARLDEDGDGDGDGDGQSTSTSTSERDGA